MADTLKEVERYSLKWIERTVLLNEHYRVSSRHATRVIDGFFG